MNLLKTGIDNVRPYWNNPRIITDAAIAMVKASIEKYGYNQPIVVDAEHIIIAGHTRYKALRAMGAQEITVIVSEMSAQQALEYRLIDNKAGELSSWDNDALANELAALEGWSEKGMFFAGLDAVIDLTSLSGSLGASVGPGTDSAGSVGAAGQAERNVGQNSASQLGEPEPRSLNDRLGRLRVSCPECLEDFYVDRDAVK